MSFFQRLAFYLFGALLGCIVVYFIWQKKDTSFCYLPNCRTLQDIRLKKRAFDPEVQQMINSKVLDTAIISYTYLNGSVDFSKSNTKLKSCKRYKIHSEFNNKTYEFDVENCDSIATIKNVTIK
ncbi:DUF4258 domain-containing protein [Pseudofulvibacter geojedonensis]|uniref:DUF4258 domain-containing protein n=1 Tax=Pseudofulvibacter geojedonensis TaxID=1123758 RepID=A0ABW3HXV3_9FLAO